ARSARAQLVRVPVGLLQHSALTRVTRGLDPRVHHSLQILFAKRMDCRVISAFTRVFRRAMPGNDEMGRNAHARHKPGTCRVVCVKGQRVSTMNPVPWRFSPPSPLSEMMSEAPGDISSEIRWSASGGMVTRSSASLAFDAGTNGAAAGSTCLPFADFLTGAGFVAPGIDTTFQRSVVLSSLTAKAVKTWVPSGR